MAQAVDDPAAALYLPAKSEVDSITEVVGADDVGPDTKVRGNQTRDRLPDARPSATCGPCGRSWPPA